MIEQGKRQWQWQEPGTAWRGVGIYHVTLTVPSREPLLGTLVIPQNDPTQARVDRTALGEAVVEELYVICKHYPAIRILQFCLMPDHLHAVIYVTEAMETSIRSVIRGYWQGVKKHGRAYTLSISPEFNSGTKNKGTQNEGTQNKGTQNEGTQNEGTQNGGTQNGGTQNGGTTDGSGYPFPVFTERPFIRPLSRRGQLQTMFRYVQMNPQRLATKRLMPGFFRVQREINVGGRNYDGVGNTMLLTAEHFETVHVRRAMVNAANDGNKETLRNYMNGCVLAARKGAVMVSPFISQHEKMVMQVLLSEQLPFILLADNGFRDYYKPFDALFDACAAGRLLILSPWPYDAGKRHISREDCKALNIMAEDFTRI
ncbi:MAG: hypothetical protein IJP80_01560 [Bacteroidales bacterium]|nr:hypothetical protein [Bacteroidales bacterium]